ncbi:MAG: hypothetical protein HY000_17755 [Planctomycetes bacterium]|nr:hypothetical protein [Planctomycetota bacterium]
MTVSVRGYSGYIKRGILCPEAKACKGRDGGQAAAMNLEVEQHWAWDPAPQPTHVIVCERRGAWAQALRRELRDFAAAIAETRSLADCRQELRTAPSSVVAIEFSVATAEAVLDFLGRLPSQFPQAVVIVLAGRDEQPWEWLVRELGAVHVAWSPREMSAVAEIVRRRLADSARQPNLAERILAEIGWGDRCLGT